MRTGMPAQLLRDTSLRIHRSWRVACTSPHSSTDINVITTYVFMARTLCQGTFATNFSCSAWFQSEVACVRRAPYIVHDQLTSQIHESIHSYTATSLRKNTEEIHEQNQPTGSALTHVMEGDPCPPSSPPITPFLLVTSRDVNLHQQWQK